jgi:hypothetical protein
MTEGWAVFDDGSISYMGFPAEVSEFYDGKIVFYWRDVKMSATGTVIGMGIKSGNWKTATYLARPLHLEEPGSLLSIDIDMTIPESRPEQAPAIEAKLW